MNGFTLERINPVLYIKIQQNAIIIIKYFKIWTLPKYPNTLPGSHSRISYIV